jgi:hypothetical protein
MLRYCVVVGVIEELEIATAGYRQTEAAHEEARARVVAAVLAALRSGQRPTDVAAKSPFTETYVRRMARENGIPEYLLRRYPKARADLEARLPGWRSVANAIVGLSIGLDDPEYVGGVLWHGLTYRGAAGDISQQKDVIVDRLTRWATRNGGSAAEVASTLREILDAYLLPSNSHCSVSCGRGFRNLPATFTHSVQRT